MKKIYEEFLENILGGKNDKEKKAKKNKNKKGNEDSGIDILGLPDEEVPL